MSQRRLPAEIKLYLGLLLTIEVARSALDDVRQRLIPIGKTLLSERGWE